VGVRGVSAKSSRSLLVPFLLEEWVKKCYWVFGFLLLLLLLLSTCVVLSWKRGVKTKRGCAAGLCHKWRHMLKTQIATATTAARTTTNTMLKMFACNLTAKTFEMQQKSQTTWAQANRGVWDLE